MAQKVGGPPVFPSAPSLTCTLLPTRGQASSLSRPSGTEPSAPPKAALPWGRLVQPTRHQKAVQLLAMQSKSRDTVALNCRCTHLQGIQNASNPPKTHSSQCPRLDI